MSSKNSTIVKWLTGKKRKATTPITRAPIIINNIDSPIIINDDGPAVNTPAININDTTVTNNSPVHTDIDISPVHTPTRSQHVPNSDDISMPSMSPLFSRSSTTHDARSPIVRPPPTPEIDLTDYSDVWDDELDNFEDLNEDELIRFHSNPYGMLLLDDDDDSDADADNGDEYSTSSSDSSDDEQEQRSPGQDYSSIRNPFRPSRWNMTATSNQRRTLQRNEDNTAVTEEQTEELNINTQVHTRVTAKSVYDYNRYHNKYPVIGAKERNFTTRFVHKVLNHNDGHSGINHAMFIVYKYVYNGDNEWLSDQAIFESNNSQMIADFLRYCSCFKMKNYVGRGIGRSYDWSASVKYIDDLTVPAQELPTVPERMKQNRNYASLLKEQKWTQYTRTKGNIQEWITDFDAFCNRYLDRNTLNRRRAALRANQDVADEISTKTDQSIIRARTSQLVTFLTACINQMVQEHAEESEKAKAKGKTPPPAPHRGRNLADFFVVENIHNYFDWRILALSNDQIANSTTNKKYIETLSYFIRKLIVWVQNHMSTLSRRDREAYIRDLNESLEVLNEMNEGARYDVSTWIGITKEVEYLQELGVFMTKEDVIALKNLCVRRLQMYLTFWQKMRDCPDHRYNAFNNTGWFLEIGQVLSIYFFLYGIGTRPRSNMQINTRRTYYKVTSKEQDQRGKPVVHVNTMVRFPGDDKSRRTTSNRHVGFGFEITEFMVTFVTQMHQQVNKAVADAESFINPNPKKRRKYRLYKVPSIDSRIIFRWTYGQPMSTDTFTKLLQRTVGFFLEKYTNARLLRFMMGAMLFQNYEGNPTMLKRLFWMQNHSAQTARIYYTYSNMRVAHDPEKSHEIIDNWFNQVEVVQNREIVVRDGEQDQDEDNSPDTIFENDIDDVDD